MTRAEQAERLVEVIEEFTYQKISYMKESGEWATTRGLDKARDALAEAIVSILQRGSL